MAKAKVTRLYDKKGRLVRLVHLPPGASTGWHFEPRDYFVTPLTDGAMQVEVSSTRRATSKPLLIALAPYRRYKRKVGRGKFIRATSKERRCHIIIYKA